MCLQEHVWNSCFCIVAYNNSRDWLDSHIPSEEKCFLVSTYKCLSEFAISLKEKNPKQWIAGVLHVQANACAQSQFRQYLLHLRFSYIPLNYVKSSTGNRKSALSSK